MREFMSKAASRIRTFAGLKFSHADLSEAQQCVEFAGGRYDVLWGVDQVRDSPTSDANCAFRENWVTSDVL